MLKGTRGRGVCGGGERERAHADACAVSMHKRGKAEAVSMGVCVSSVGKGCVCRGGRGVCRARVCVCVVVKMTVRCRGVQQKERGGPDHTREHACAHTHRPHTHATREWLRGRRPWGEWRVWKQLFLWHRRGARTRKRGGRGSRLESPPLSLATEAGWRIKTFFCCGSAGGGARGGREPSSPLCWAATEGAGGRRVCVEQRRPGRRPGGAARATKAPQNAFLRGKERGCAELAAPTGRALGDRYGDLEASAAAGGVGRGARGKCGGHISLVCVSCGECVCVSQCKKAAVSVYTCSRMSRAHGGVLWGCFLAL